MQIARWRGPARAPSQVCLPRNHHALLPSWGLGTGSSQRSKCSGVSGA